MGIPNILNSGRTGLIASKVAIATSGHNIANAGTEGFSRQRVQTAALDSEGGKYGKNIIGSGTRVSRVERINDEYIEKQVRNGYKEVSHYEEKDFALKQIEDIFNEMNGDGLNRLVSRFFNEFRKLGNEPESLAVRQSVREASRAMIHDFHRLKREVDAVREHLDAKIEGYVSELNSIAAEVTDLNDRIIQLEATKSSPNDLLDKRDLALKKLNSFLDVSVYKDKQGRLNVDIKGYGPFINGNLMEKLSVYRSPADDQGKPENAYDIQTSANPRGILTHLLKGGKLGALLETRDKTLSHVLSRLDELAFGLSSSVNAIHRQGVSPEGYVEVDYFKPMNEVTRASEFISLSDEVEDDVNFITTALIPNAPGDNRIAIAISQLQFEKVMGDRSATLDEWYNSIVSNVGVATSRNRFALNQQKDILTQLSKVRDQISGVSIDEETTHLLEYQHIFDASSKVIQVADELLKTVLSLKRD